MYKEYLDMLPEHMRDAVERYIDCGIPGGSFLDAVVRHDLFEAIARADFENQAALVDWVKFFYNYAPSSCHGNNARVDAWISHHGLEGLKENA